MEVAYFGLAMLLLAVFVDGVAHMSVAELGEKIAMICFVKQTCVSAPMTTMACLNTAPAQFKQGTHGTRALCPRIFQADLETDRPTGAWPKHVHVERRTHLDRGPPADCNTIHARHESTGHT